MNKVWKQTVDTSIKFCEIWTKSVLQLILNTNTVVSELLCDPMDCSLPVSSLSMGFSRQEYWSGLPCPSPGHLHNPGVKPRSSAPLADSLPSEPPGKPKNTGVGSLSPGDLLNPGMNWGLLHCRQNFCQLSYQGSPVNTVPHVNFLFLFLFLFYNIVSLYYFSELD